jgi:hypothetical protein
MSDIRVGDLITLKGDFVPLSHRGHYFLVMKTATDADTEFYHVFDHLRSAEMWYTQREVKKAAESNDESR